MLANYFKYFVVCLIFTSTSAIQEADVDTTITVALNKTVTRDNREIYGDFITLKNSTMVQVNFTDVDANYFFLIFQVHSQFDNITLYQKSLTGTNNVINGTNVGLVNIFRFTASDEPKTDTFYIENAHTDVNVRVYFSVHVYEWKDPIPGGCNMIYIEPMPQIAPYIEVKINDAYITLLAASPSTDFKCEDFGLTFTDYYLMYLPVSNFDADNYFNAIRKMMNLKNIYKYGKIVQKVFWEHGRLISVYPGTGVIFVAVTRYWDAGEYRRAVYVPNHSYGCVNANENGCGVSDDIISQILCTLLLLVGLFMSFFGHRFFKTEMFLSGFFSGFIITYMVLNIIESDMDISTLLIASTLSGALFGGTWLLFWWLYDIPVVAISLVALNVGFIITSILFYKLPDKAVVYLQDDIRFWTIFAIMMFLTTLVLVVVPYNGNILCCAILGGSATTYALDFFLQANLKYIVINIVRRTVVPIFNMVILLPPYTWKDAFVTFIGLLVTQLGWSFQLWQNKNKPKFPPPSRSPRLARHQGPTYGVLTDETRQPVQIITTDQPSTSERRVKPATYNEKTHLLA